MAQNRLCSALSTASSVNGPGRWIRSPPPPAADPLLPGPLPAAGGGPWNDRRCVRWLFDSVFCCVATAIVEVGDGVALIHFATAVAAWPPFCDSSLPLNSLSAHNKKNTSYKYDLSICFTIQLFENGRWYY